MKSLLIRIEGYEPNDLKVSQMTYDELLHIFYAGATVDIRDVDPLDPTKFIVAIRPNLDITLPGHHLQAINDIVIAYNKLG